MNNFKLSLNADLPEHVAGSVERRFRESGLIVRAPSEQKAREWACRTTGVAVERGPDGLIPTSAWLDYAASTCVIVQGPVPKPVYLVSGVDIAQRHPDEDQRETGPEGEQIVWWPCSPKDMCPA